MGDEGARSPASEDPEIRAIVALRGALEPLDHQQVARVLAWASTRYGDAGLIGTSRELLGALNEALGASLVAAEKMKIAPGDMEAIAMRILRDYGAPIADTEV